MKCSIIAIIALSACNGADIDTPVSREFSVVEDVCAAGPTTFGIDVSRYQGDIDWSLVAGADVKFAYIQISRRIDDIDAKFEVNWAGAKSVGILRGAYQRFQPDQDVRAQADIFLDKLGPFQEGDLPPMLDVEDSGNLPAEVIAAKAREWLVYVETELGVRPIVYTGRYFWEDTVNSADFTEYPLWIAHYTKACPDIPSPWTNWAIHQYSSTAVLPGITANTVDVNTFNGTIEELLALGCGDSCEPCQVIEGAGGILDESGACFTVGGNPEFMRTESEGHEGNLRWTHTTDAAQVGNFGLWRLFFAEAGEYLIEAHTPAPWNMSQLATYLVQRGGMETAVQVDQGAVDGWSPLGEFSFVSGGGQSIRLNDNTGEANESNTKLVFDAIRFTRTDDVSPLLDAGPSDGGSPEEPSNKMESGCQLASGDSGSGWGILLLAFVFWQRRRICL